MSSREHPPVTWSLGEGSAQSRALPTHRLASVLDDNLTAPVAEANPIGDEQEAVDADQRASVADQRAADIDHAASEAGEAASYADQQRSDLEQHASDLDQAAADRDDQSSSPDARRAHDASRVERLEATAARAACTESRKLAETARSREDERRDDAAVQRDSTADDRDARSNLRDVERGLSPVLVLRSEDGANEQPAAQASAAAARTNAASQRAAAALARAGAVQRSEVTGSRLGWDHRPARRRRALRGALQGAVARGELSVNYQPVCDLQTNEILTFEALARWVHPTLGSVAPLEFIPLAESGGTILSIGQWVLDTALDALGEWRVQTRRPLSVAVNVAAEQLAQNHFCGDVLASLERAGLPPEALTLEVTERTCATDQPTVRATMLNLAAAGVRLSLDDFGSGFSCLGVLADLPVDELKVDRAFVTEIVLDSRKRALVGGVVSMANALGLSVVGEGIETQQQRMILRDLGCQLGQGYLFAKPMPASLVVGLLETARSLTPVRSAVTPA